MTNASPCRSWRRIVVVSLWLTGCGVGAGAGHAAPERPAAAPAEAPTAADSAATETHELKTISGEVSVVSGDVVGLTAAIRAHAAEVGGSVAREDVRGDAQHREASAVLRLPPEAMSSFIDWLGARATIDSRHAEITDVTRRYFDREVAIRNLEVTLERLRELARRPDAELNDVMVVERELTRVRGELEALRGEQRLLADRVARATLTITITMNPAVHEPELKFELMPHLSQLRLVDPGARAADRTGGGVTLMFSRALSLDFDVFPRRGDDARSYLVTAALAAYSDFLGGGQRRLGNPYLGLRFGGAKMNGQGAFAYGVDAGVELVRYKQFLVEISGRAIGLWYNRDAAPRSDLLLEATLGVGIPF